MDLPPVPVRRQRTHPVPAEIAVEHFLEFCDRVFDTVVRLPHNQALVVVYYYLIECGRPMTALLMGVDEKPSTNTAGER